MYIERHLSKVIEEANNYYPVIMICGQRQVGKSTMLNHIKEPNRRYVTLDDRNALRLAENDPALFFETYGLPILIDEFQRAPSLTLEIKRIVDDKRLNGDDANGLIWLSGSQSFRMMKNVSDSLAGRIGIFTMSGLSKSEIEHRKGELFIPKIDILKQRMGNAIHKDIHQLYQQIFRGGLPYLYSTNVPRERYYSDYINTYLERDIKDLEQVGKLNEFYDFLVFMAARTGQELKYDEIAKNIGISAPTAKMWTTILERSGIIYILHPYYNNITNRLVKTPKMYFMDTGLASYLCRWSDEEVLASGAMSGAILETYIVSEIIKTYYNTGHQPNLYYYRDIDKKEIDLLIDEADTIYPIEIKKSKSPSDAGKNFPVLQKLQKNIAPGLILCLSDELVPLSRDLWLCPIDVI
jgi:predicted AAA+ superfamily ATPase